MPRLGFLEVDALSRIDTLIVRRSIWSALATYCAVLAVTAIALLCGGRIDQRAEVGTVTESLPSVTKYAGIAPSDRDRLLIQSAPRVAPGLRQNRLAFDRHPSATFIAPELPTTKRTARSAAVDWRDYVPPLRDVGRASHPPRAPPLSA